MIYQAGHFHLTHFRMVVVFFFKQAVQSSEDLFKCNMIGKWPFSDKGEIPKECISPNCQVPFCDAHLLNIRLCLTQLQNLSWLLLLREREHLRTFFRTPFCASAQWQKNLLSIKVINCLIGGVSNPHCKICLCQIHKTLIFFVCCCKPHVVWSCSLTSPCYQAEVCASRDGVCLPCVSCVLSLPQQGSSASDMGTPLPSWPSGWVTWGSM